MPDPDYSGSELARWLQETGRRRVARKADSPPTPMVAGPAAGEKRTYYVSHPRELLLFFLAALAYLPYMFADVYVQIASLPCVIVFV